LRFAIGDSGRGLTAALASLGPADDRHAVELALRVGITGRSRAQQLAEPRAMRNRGVGLSAIARLVAANQGVFLLWSGSAAWSRFGSSTGVQGAPPWQGVLLAATLPRVKFIKNERDIIRELMPELGAAEVEQRQSRVGLP
jgi:hypothetical protein